MEVNVRVRVSVRIRVRIRVRISVRVSVRVRIRIRKGVDVDTVRGIEARVGGQGRRGLREDRVQG